MIWGLQTTSKCTTSILSSPIRCARSLCTGFLLDTQLLVTDSDHQRQKKPSPLFSFAVANPQDKESPPARKTSDLTGAKGAWLKLIPDTHLSLSQESFHPWPPPPLTQTSSIPQFHSTSFYGAHTQCSATKQKEVEDMHINI